MDNNDSALMYYFGGVSPDCAYCKHCYCSVYKVIVTGAAVVSSAVSATPIGAAAVRFWTAFEFYNLAADKNTVGSIVYEYGKTIALCCYYNVYSYFCMSYIRHKKYANRFMIGAFSAFMVLQCVVNKTAPAEIVFFDAGQGRRFDYTYSPKNLRR